MNTELIKEAERIGKEIAIELYETITDRNIVGGQESQSFKHEECKYNIIVDAFWEKCRFFSYKLKDSDNNIINSVPVIEF